MNNADTATNTMVSWKNKAWIGVWEFWYFSKEISYKRLWSDYQNSSGASAANNVPYRLTAFGFPSRRAGYIQSFGIIFAVTSSPHFAAMPNLWWKQIRDTSNGCQDQDEAGRSSKIYYIWNHLSIPSGIVIKPPVAILGYYWGDRNFIE